MCFLDRICPNATVHPSISSRNGKSLLVPPLSEGEVRWGSDLPWPLLPKGGGSEIFAPPVAGGGGGSARFAGGRKGLFLLGILLLAAAPVHAATRAAVTIYPTATVAATDVTLGDIASIQCADKSMLAHLSAAVMGRAPMPGMTRPLTGGDVRLKLRQDGIDPGTVAFAGSDTVTISAVASSSPDAVSLTPTPAGAAKSAEILVHAGDGVNLVYECDGVVITARVTAITSGAAGDQISIHRDAAERALRGTVLDAQTIRLEE